ncbi:MAG: SGNH/GDSL hydrolase family protein [Actinomycetota bacterium]|nr:SGNH/GDSL hydrolase family protein [Actinomycetota bacterium]
MGDSFTEGLNDDVRFDGRHRGWADRVAEGLLARQDIDELAYGNLAIRGRLIAQVRSEQVPVAVSMRPDLVTFAAGVNDALRKNFDLNAVVTDLEVSVKALRQSGAQVLVFAYGDPSRRTRSLSSLTARMRSLRSATLEVARIYDCFLVDFWGVSTYDDERLWSADRLHLSPLGHRVTALAVLEELGLGDPSWRSPVSAPPRVGFTRRRIRDAAWFGAHAGPWFARRVRKVSSGAGIEPKDPTYRIVN